MKSYLLECFTRLTLFFSKLVAFYELGTNKDPTFEVYDICHDQKRLVEQILLLVSVSLLHGQVHSPVYHSLFEVTQKLRQLLHSVILKEFGIFNEKVRSVSNFHDEVERKFFEAKQKQAVLNVLFEEHVDCSESTDTVREVEASKGDDTCADESSVEEE